MIDDTYNANPDSFRAAIDLLAAAPRARAGGGMGEWWCAGRSSSRDGTVCRERGIDTFFAIGPLMREAAQEFGANAAHFDDIRVLIDALRPRLRAGTTVLVKGSRFMQMERVVQSLSAQQTETVH